MRLVYIREAADMLGISRATLMSRLTPDRRWVLIYGGRLRTYPIDIAPKSKFRMDADEINRLLIRLQKRRPPQ